jgi:hypothetical protein
MKSFVFVVSFHAIDFYLLSISLSFSVCHGLYRKRDDFVNYGISLGNKV